MRAEHVDLGRQVAIKFMLTAKEQAEANVVRFFREAQLVNRIRHPHVVDVTDIDWLPSGAVYIVMELLHGRCLQRAISTGPLPLGLIQRIAHQSAAALSAVHAAGIIHRDIKPGNLFLCDDQAEPHLKILDFGVAKLGADSVAKADVLTVAGGVVGTVAYMAPEQARAEELDARADLFSLAATLYEAATGYRPFRSHALGALVHEHTTYVPPRLSQVLGAGVVPAALDETIASALQVDPHRRPPSAAAFADALSGSTPPARSLSLPAPRPRAARSSRHTAVAVCLHAHGAGAALRAIAEATEAAGGLVLERKASALTALFGVPDVDSSTFARALEVAESVRDVSIVLELGRVRVRRAPTGIVATGSLLTRLARLASITCPGLRLGPNAHRWVYPLASGDAEMPRPDARPSHHGELVRMVSAALAGDDTACHIVIDGPPGAGTTYSLHTAREKFDASARWHAARARPGDRGFYATLTHLVPALAEQLRAAPTRHDERIDAWLTAEVSSGPLVIALDDAEYADEASMATLRRLAELGRGKPIAVIVAGHQLDHDGGQRLSLEPLADRAATQLAAALAPAASRAEIDAVVARAAGCARYVVELARDLDANGSGAEESATSPALELATRAHLDAMLPHARRIYEIVAIAQQAGWAELLVALAVARGSTADEAREALWELEECGAIVAAEDGPATSERFVAAVPVLAETAYRELSSEQRRALHLDLATRLEAEGEAEAVPAIPSLLAAARQYAAAGAIDHAARCDRRAGAALLAAGDHRGAHAALVRAIDASAPSSELLEQAGDAAMVAAGLDAAQDLYARALDLSEPDELTRARLWRKLGDCATQRGDNAVAAAYYERGIAALAPDGELTPRAEADAVTAAELYAALGWLRGYQLGDFEIGSQLGARALELLEGTEHQQALAHALSRLGGCYMRGGRYAEQLACNERTLEVSIGLGDTWMEMIARLNLGITYLTTGRITEARAQTTRALAMARRTDSVRVETVATNNLGAIELEAGDPYRALAHFERAAELVLRSGYRSVLPELHRVRARAYAAINDLHRANRDARRSRALATQLEASFEAGLAARVLALIALRLDNPQRASALLDEAAAQIGTRDPLECARLSVARALLARAEGAPDADDQLAAAHSELERLGLAHEIAAFAANSIR